MDDYFIWRVGTRCAIQRSENGPDLRRVLVGKSAGEEFVLATCLGLNDGFRDLLTSSLPLFSIGTNVLTQPVAFSNDSTYMSVHPHPILPFRLCLAYYPFAGQFECGHEICYANS